MKPNGYPARAEAPKTKTENITESFRDSQRIINKMTASPSFHGTLELKGINPYNDISTEKYWDAFATYANRHITAMRQRPDVDRLKLDTLELLANTPQLLHKQANLDASERKDRREKRIACTFNSMVGDFTRKYPDTSVTTMRRGLLNMANAAIEDPEVGQNSYAFTNSILRGVQHENVMGQTLAHTGRGFRKSTITEDLSGFDYEVEGMGASPLYIDVKASRHDTDGKDFKFRPNGTVIVASMAQEREFHDRFFIDEPLAAVRASSLDAMLDTIELQSKAPAHLASVALSH